MEIICMEVTLSVICMEDNGQKCTSIVLRGALNRTCCDVPGDATYYPVCCYIAPDMSLYRTAHAVTSYLMLLYRTRRCYIVPLMLLHRTFCCYIVLGDAISTYRSCYYIVPYAAISYTVMFCRTAHAITSYLMLLYRTR